MPPASVAACFGLLAGCEVASAGTRLTVNIKSASDGHMDLQVLGLPKLEVSVKAVRDIPEAVAKAAVAMTGKPIDHFKVEIGY
ncbi:hypothetical protein NicSoilE8_43250 (plasmid) [Arthrobacter sp. NicSoilE8]|nr:hypothetical protein NicSoilE8_43250 [Arthrobacter sp. NicSoilE8]